MRPLSATECITPAIEHAKAMLRPFSLKLWLKLGFVAILAEMSGQFLSPPIGNMRMPSTSSATPGIGALAGGITLAVMLVVGVVFFIVGLVLLYLGSRMQLVLMDLVATRTTLVGPAWQRTAPRTWRWIGLKLVTFLITFAILGALAVVPIIYFIRSMPGHGAQPGPASFASIALFIVAIIVAILILMIVIWSLRDFVLPYLLFEDASFSEAFSRAIALITQEPGPVFVYLLMKLVITLLFGIAAELCIVLGLLIAAIPTGAIGAILYYSLHNAGPLGTAVMYISFALLGLIFVAAFIVILLCIGAALLLFFQAYALYFMGGRIPNLGALLEPPIPQYTEVPPPQLA